MYQILRIFWKKNGLFFSKVLFDWLNVGRPISYRCLFPWFLFCLIECDTCHNILFTIYIYSAFIDISALDVYDFISFEISLLILYWFWNQASYPTMFIKIHNTGTFWRPWTQGLVFARDYWYVKSFLFNKTITK